MTSRSEKRGGLREQGERKAKFGRPSLLGGRRELGDGLGTLGDGVLGKLSREDKSNGSLNLSRRDGRSTVVNGELGSLGRDSLEDVRDERVEDRHGLV